MKIALVNQPFGTINLPWDGSGGSIDIWTYEVARRLARSCDVVVYTRRSRNQKRLECYEGVKYQRISTRFDSSFEYLSSAVDKSKKVPGLQNSTPMIRRALFFSNPKRPLFASYLYHPSYAWQVAKDLKEEKCDIVHVINFSQFIPIMRAVNPKIKTVLHMRCDWLAQLDFSMIEKRLRKVDVVIGNSDYITNRIRHRFPLFASRCRTVYNAVETKSFLPKTSVYNSNRKGAHRLLFVGRVSPEKGVHILVSAFKRILQHYPQTRLDIVGPDSVPPFEFVIPLSDDQKVSDLASFYNRSHYITDYVSQLRDMLSQSELSKACFTGSVPHNQLVKLYQDASVFVFPSIWDEPFGIPVIEAMATGVPVVATRVGGIPEIIEDSATGILVEPNKTSALTEAILRLLANPDLRESMGKAGRSRAARLFSWERIVEELLDIYRNLYDDDKKTMKSQHA